MRAAWDHFEAPSEGMPFAPHENEHNASHCEIRERIMKMNTMQVIARFVNGVNGSKQSHHHQGLLGPFVAMSGALSLSTICKMNLTLL